LENRENPDAVRDQFRRFCELVTVFPEIGTLVASSRVSARRILLPDIEFHVYYRVRPRARRGRGDIGADLRTQRRLSCITRRIAVPYG
jgi:hypothetical protein